MEMQIAERKPLTEHNRTKVQSIVRSALRITDAYIHYQSFSVTKRFTTDAITRKNILDIAAEVNVMAKFLTSTGVVGASEANRIAEILNVFAEHADIVRSNIFTRKKRVESELVPLKQELFQIAESRFKTVLYHEKYQDIADDEAQIEYR